MARRRGQQRHQHAVTPAQVLELAGRDQEHGQPGTQQRVDDRAIGAFDPDLVHTRGEQPTDQLAQSSRGVRGGEPLARHIVGSDHGDRGVIAAQ